MSGVPGVIQQILEGAPRGARVVVARRPRVRLELWYSERLQRSLHMNEGVDIGVACGLALDPRASFVKRSPRPLSMENRR